MLICRHAKVYILYTPNFEKRVVNPVVCTCATTTTVKAQFSQQLCFKNHVCPFSVSWEKILSCYKQQYHPSGQYCKVYAWHPDGGPEILWACTENIHSATKRCYNSQAFTSTQRPKVQANLHIHSPHQVCCAPLRTKYIGWRGNKQTVGGQKLPAEWWRNKGKLGHQPTLLCRLHISHWPASFAAGLVKLCACASLKVCSHQIW
jgi:hypothetical protein